MLSEDRAGGRESRRPFITRASSFAHPESPPRRRRGDGGLGGLRCLRFRRPQSGRLFWLSRPLSESAAESPDVHAVHEATANMRARPQLPGPAAGPWQSGIKATRSDSERPRAWRITARSGQANPLSGRARGCDRPRSYAGGGPGGRACGAGPNRGRAFRRIGIGVRPQHTALSLGALPKLRGTSALSRVDGCVRMERRCDTRKSRRANRRRQNIRIPSGFV